jgi:F0F1-type ATP synthase membrane subunit b/b'
MRRAILTPALALALASFAFSQENSLNPSAEVGDPWIIWKWVNFVILAAGLGYLISKAAPGYFQGRIDEIQGALAEAAHEIKEAEMKAADLDRRFSGIQSEVGHLRDEAHHAMSAEAARIEAETERHLKRIQDQTAQEIALLARVARDELRKFSAGLALDLAEQRVKSRITADTQARLVDDFLQDLQHRARPDVRA